MAVLVASTPPPISCPFHTPVRPSPSRIVNSDCTIFDVSWSSPRFPLRDSRTTRETMFAQRSPRRSNSMVRLRRAARNLEKADGSAVHRSICRAPEGVSPNAASWPGAVRHDLALPSRRVPGGAGTTQSAVRNVTAPAIRVPKTAPRAILRTPETEGVSDGSIVDREMERERGAHDHDVGSDRTDARRLSLPRPPQPPRPPAAA